MSKVIVTKSKIDDVNDELSTAIGTNANRTLASMKTVGQGINSTISTQAGLLDDCIEALAGKAAGGMTADALITYDSENAGVKSYMTTAAAYTDADDHDDGTITVITPDHTNGYDRPAIPTTTGHSAELTIPSGGAVIYWTDEDTGEGWSESVSAGTYSVKNLLPDHSYFYRIDNSSGAVLQSGRYEDTATVRMIYFSDSRIRNFRDLGGWTCDGGTVKYGKLIRGAQINYKGSNSTTEYCGTVDVKQLHDVLKIKHEIDMRSSGAAVQSAVAGLKDMKYSYYELSDATYVENLGTANLTSILKLIIDNAIHNIPTYFHCSKGQDRTGLVAYIINATLGVGQADLDKDYELTSFYKVSENASNYNALRTNSNYAALVAYFAPSTGETLRDNVVQWLVNLGITVDTINKFRSAMIDGTPTELDAADFAQPYTVEYNLTNVTKNANAPGVVTANGSFTATLTADTTNSYEIIDVSVTMGGSTVSGAYNSSTGGVSIAEVTGNVVVTALGAKEVLATAGTTADTRLNSSGGTATLNGCAVTGFFPCANGSVITIVNTDVATAVSGQLSYYAFYADNTGDGTLIKTGTYKSSVTNEAKNLGTYITAPDGSAIGNYPTTFKIKSSISGASPVQYMRISCGGFGANSKIYVS